MTIYATFDAAGNQDGFTTLDTPLHGYYEIDNPDQTYKLVNGTPRVLLSSELLDVNLVKATEEKVRKIKLDYIVEVSSNVKTDAGHTWQSDKTGGIEQTGRRIESVRAMAIADGKSSMQFSDTDDKVVTLKVDPNIPKDEALAEAVHIGNYLQAAFYRKKKRERKANACKSIEELKAI